MPSRCAAATANGALRPFENMLAVESWPASICGAASAAAQRAPAARTPAMTAILTRVELNLWGLLVDSGRLVALPSLLLSVAAAAPPAKN